MRAAKTFTVSHGGVRIKVRMLPTILDVHRHHQATCKQHRGGTLVHAFFLPSPRQGRLTGAITLPLLDGRLQELVPHEVSHAVIQAHGGVLQRDDEEYCTTVGILCARIHRRIEQIRAAENGH